jgi:hypothetical protein
MTLQKLFEILVLLYTVSNMASIGLELALTVGGRYYADKPADGPDWGLRFAVIFLFPK